MRDYGTGEWEGGDAECDHKTRERGEMKADVERRGYAPGSNFANYQAGYESGDTFKDVCGKCGARRVDQQLGLEPTPDLYVQRMVEVFREVRRVLRDDGTCWLNLGDSYAANRSYQVSDSMAHDFAGSNAMTVPPGLKPKDLCGIPWRVAFALQADGWYLRSDIIWSKPNPMPESVTDRPTKAHEFVFLLTKSPRYFFDQEAVREPLSAATTSDARYVRALNGETPYGDAVGKAQELGRGSRVKFAPERNDGDPDSMYKHPPSPLGRKHGRRSIGIELNPAYCELAARRMQQQSLEFA